MTRANLIQFWNGLSEVKHMKANVRFAFAVAKNIEICKPEIEPMRAFQPSPEFFKRDEKEPEEYARLMEERKTQLREAQPILEEEVEIKIRKISLKDVPSDISANELEGIMVMIIE